MDSNCAVELTKIWGKMEGRTVVKMILLGFLLILGTAESVMWDDLKVTYGLNIFSKYGFNHIERTMADVTNEMNWVPLMGRSECINQIGDFKFYGFPMTERVDKSVVTLYDKKGTIAGIQAYFPHDEILSKQMNYRFDKQPMFRNATLNGKTYFVLTAYFVHPDTICSEGRDSDALEKEGTGTGLWLQNGPTPDSYMEVPTKRSKAIKKGWTKCNCFIGMGYHNFYDLPHVREANCTDSLPAFLLYNKKGELHGFGFVVPGYASSPKFEHPPSWAVRAIVGSQAPECVFEQVDTVGTTTMHVYFISKPMLIWCPLW